MITVTPNPQPYPPGEEPGLDTLPDGRRVAVRTAWPVGDMPAHYDNDTGVALPSTAAMKTPAGPWHVWRNNIGIAAHASEPAAVRALVGLPMEEP